MTATLKPREIKRFRIVYFICKGILENTHAKAIAKEAGISPDWARKVKRKILRVFESGK